MVEHLRMLINRNLACVTFNKGLNLPVCLAIELNWLSVKDSG
ncbi:hypothetical protein ACIRXL_04085 [Avibacterium paragallinarum]